MEVELWVARLGVKGWTNGIDPAGAGVAPMMLHGGVSLPVSKDFAYATPLMSPSCSPGGQNS